MDAKLIVIVGKASKPIVDLKLPTIIGRGREAGLTIAHPMVSRQHCVLFEEQGLLMVRDLGSTNGTFLQGQRIAVAPLLPGTEFTVGPLTFRTDYQYDGDPEEAPPVQFKEEPGRGGEEEELEFMAADEGEEAAPAEAAGDADDLAFETYFEEELAQAEPAPAAVAEDNVDEEEAEAAMPPSVPPPVKKKPPPAVPKKQPAKPAATDAPKPVEEAADDEPRILDHPEAIDQPEAVDRVQVPAKVEGGTVPDVPAEPELLAEPELAEAESEPEVLAEPELAEPKPAGPKAKRTSPPEPELADIENFLGGLD